MFDTIIICLFPSLVSQIMKKQMKLFQYFCRVFIMIVFLIAFCIKCVCVCVCVCVLVCVCMCVREREREREVRKKSSFQCITI